MLGDTLLSLTQQIRRSQLTALAQLVKQNYDAQRRDFRILAVHHPVHYPPERPTFGMSMKDDREVAETLGVPCVDGPYPLAHLVLSGHTHFLFPKHGKMPAQACLCVHPHLGEDQCQFVVGSLMQLDRRQTQEWSQQCEVLRLYHCKDEPVLMVERLLAARQLGREYRQTGMGRYDFVSIDGRTTNIAEPITFNLY